MREARILASRATDRASRGTPVLSIAGAARALLVGALAMGLAGCPEERPGAAREIPPQRVPPAMPLEPQPAPTIGPRRPEGAAVVHPPGEGAARPAPTTTPVPGRSEAR